MEKIIFRNSKRYINEGIGFGEGILYCGDQYTNEKCCSCGSCDGHCGIDNGCPCPDCEYTLSYILYSTGKMKCGKCQKTLIRLKQRELKTIYSSQNINTFKCDSCNKRLSNELYIPLMHCLKCKYNLCPKCAFAKITPFEQENIKIEEGFNDGVGMIYCRKNYTNESFCLCGSCDGNCGEENGCPCPLCDAILAYNIYLKSNKMRCEKCNNNLRIKTTVGIMKKAKKKILPCILCSRQLDKDDYHVIYNCTKCLKNVCQKCAYEFNIKNINNICYPKMPLFFDIIEKNLKDKIKKEALKNIKIIKQTRFKITKEKEKGNNISIYLKTLVGRIYTIVINDNEDVTKLKEELRKFDKKFIDCNTLLIYKNRKLEDYDYLKDVGIGNECLINVILK